MVKGRKPNEDPGRDASGSANSTDPPSRPPTNGPMSPPPSGPSPEQFLDALRADFAGLEEVCRWQWNLIQRLKSRLSTPPADWPGKK